MEFKNTTIALRGMRFRAFHGVVEQERKVGNDFEVTLLVYVPMQQAIEGDDLAGTVNYAELYAVVEREMAVPSALLEHVAGRIAKAVKAQFPVVTGGFVSVAKLNPPFKSDLQKVEVSFDF